MKLKPNQAWHFIRRDAKGIDRLRDGTEAPKDGEWLEFEGPLIMCKSGLHFSRHPFDALQYAPGGLLCLVEVGGEIIDGDDKGVCSRRKIIKRLDATEGLRYFARMQALSVLHLYPGDPADCVLDYLMGDDSLRSAAYSAADSAAYSAAESAAWSAAWSAAYSAAYSAALSAADSAALSAADSAARADWSALVNEAFEVEE